MTRQPKPKPKPKPEVIMYAFLVAVFITILFVSLMAFVIHQEGQELEDGDQPQGS